MTEWRQTAWGELATLRYGKALRDYRNDSGPTTVFGTNGPIGFVSSAPHSGGPGVIVGRKGAYRGIHYTDGPFSVIDTAFWLEPIEKLDLRWAYYELLTHDINSMDSGSAIPSTSRDAFYQLPVVVPPLKEQRAIAATLGALDDKIESNRRMIEKIADLLDAASELHGQGLAAVPLRDLTTSFKVSAAPSKLGDSMVDHFSLPAFDSGAQPERVSASAIMSNKLKVPESAILLSRLNPRFNRTWWASAQAGVPALASTEFLVLTAESEQQLAAVWLAVRDPHFREQLPKRVTGTSGSHQRVRPDDVLSINVPDFAKSREGVKQEALALLRRTASLRSESDRLVALRDALLPELLSGRIRVPVEANAA